MVKCQQLRHEHSQTGSGEVQVHDLLKSYVALYSFIAAPMDSLSYITLWILIISLFQQYVQHQEARSLSYWSLRIEIQQAQRVILISAYSFENEVWVIYDKSSELMTTCQGQVLFDLCWKIALIVVRLGLNLALVSIYHNLGAVVWSFLISITAKILFLYDSSVYFRKYDDSGAKRCVSFAVMAGNAWREALADQPCFNSVACNLILFYIHFI